MALVNNVSTGIGSGEAQVFNNGNTINIYARMLQQQQAKRAAEEQLLASELSQVKVDGIREPDRQEFFNKYQELKDIAAKVPYERNTFAKAQLKAEINKKLLEVNDFAQRSKTYGKSYTDLQGRLLDSRLRDQFTDDAVSQVQQANKLPMSDPRFIKDFTSLGRQVDAEKIDKMVGGIDATLLKKSAWGNPVMTKGAQGDKNGVMVYNKREVTPTEQISAYANIYDAEPNFRKYIQDQYGDLFAQNPQQAKALAIKDFADKRRATGTLSESTAPQFKPDYKPENWREKMLFAEMLRRNRPDKAKEIADDGRDEFVQALANQDTDARAELVRAVNRSGGHFVPSKSGFTVTIPRKTSEMVDDGSGNLVAKTVVQNKTYTIPKDVSEGAMQTINGLLNETDLFAKRPLYKKKENQYTGQPRQSSGAKPATATSSAVQSFDVDGRVFNIPADKVGSFLKSFPKAKKR